MAEIREWSRFGVMWELLRRGLVVSDWEVMVALVAAADEDCAFETPLADLMTVTGRSKAAVTRALSRLLEQGLIARIPSSVEVQGFVNAARIGGLATHVGTLADGSPIHSSTSPVLGDESQLWAQLQQTRRSSGLSYVCSGEPKTATRSDRSRASLPDPDKTKKEKRKKELRAAPAALDETERDRLRSLVSEAGLEHADAVQRHAEIVVLASATSTGRRSADWTSAVFGGIMRGWALEGFRAEGDTTTGRGRGRMASTGERRGRRSGPNIMRAEPAKPTTGGGGDQKRGRERREGDDW